MLIDTTCATPEEEWGDDEDVGISGTDCQSNTSEGVADKCTSAPEKRNAAKAFGQIREISIQTKPKNKKVCSLFIRVFRKPNLRAVSWLFWTKNIPQLTTNEAGEKDR